MSGPEQRRPYIRVSLLIRGGEDPAEITRILNIEPDESHRKGEAIPVPPDAKYVVKKTRKYSVSAWMLNASLDHYSYDVQDYADDVLRRVHHVRNRIAQLDRRRYNVTLDVALDLLTDASTPALGLSQDAMELLVSLKASFDVDMYAWKELPPYALAGLRRFSKIE